MVVRGGVTERDELPQQLRRQQQRAQQPWRGSGRSAVIFSKKEKREKKEGMGDGKGRR